MTDTPRPTESSKPQEFSSPSKSRQSRPEKPDQTEAPTTARPAAVRADQPVDRLMTVTVTIDADSGEVVRVEGVDTTGARRELSDDEKTSLIKERRDERVQELVYQAFEAGIAAVLGTDVEEKETTQESPEEADFRRRLLAPLIARTAFGQQLTERAALNRAILGTLIEHSRK